MYCDIMMGGVGLDIVGLGSGLKDQEGGTGSVVERLRDMATSSARGLGM